MSTATYLDSIRSKSTGSSSASLKARVTSRRSRSLRSQCGCGATRGFPPRFSNAEALPTYVVPGRIYRTQIARLHTLAALLSGDHIVEDAIAQVRIHLNGVLV